MKKSITLLLLFYSFLGFSQTTQQLEEINSFIKNSKCNEAEKVLLEFDYVNSTNKALPLILKNLAGCVANPEKAIEIAQKALELNQKQENNQPNELQVLILLDLGNFYLIKGNRNDAESLIKRATSLTKEIKNIDKNTLLILYQTLSKYVLNNQNHKLNIAIQKKITVLLKELNREDEFDYWDAQIVLALELIELNRINEAQGVLESFYPFDNPKMYGKVFDYLTSSLLFIYAKDSITLNKKTYHLLNSIDYNKITYPDLKDNIVNSIYLILKKTITDGKYSTYITKEELNNCILKNLQFLFYTSLNKSQPDNNLLIDQSIQYFENYQSDSLSQFDKKLISTIISIPDTSTYLYEKMYVLNVAAKYCEKLRQYDLAEECYMKEFFYISKYKIDNDISKIFIELLNLHDSKGTIDEIFPLFDSFLQKYKFNEFSKNEIYRFMTIGYLFKADYKSFSKTLKNVLEHDRIATENNERVSYWSCINSALNAIDLIKKEDSLEAVSQLVNSFHSINRELISFAGISIPYFNDDIVFHKNLYKIIYKHILPTFNKIKNIDFKQIIESAIDKNRLHTPFSNYFNDVEKRIFEEKKTELLDNEKLIFDELNKVGIEEKNLKIVKIKTGTLYEKLAEIHFELRLDEKAIFELEQAKILLKDFDEIILRINNKLISVYSQTKDVKILPLLKENELLLLKQGRNHSKELANLYEALGRYYTEKQNYIESINYFKKEYDILLTENSENVFFSDKSAVTFGLGTTYFLDLKDTLNGVTYLKKFLKHQTEYYKNLLGKITENQFYNLYSEVSEIETIEFFAKTVLIDDKNPNKDILLEFDFMKKNFFLTSELLLKKKNPIDNNFSHLKLVSKLDENEIAIEFGYTFKASKKKYYAFLSSKKPSQPLFVNLCTQQQIDSLWKVSKQSEVNNIINQFYNNPKLYELIWKPLEQHLVGVSKIYFAPAGGLHKIAFQALTGSDGEKLSKKYNLIQLTSTRELMGKELYTINSNASFALFGGINYDADSMQLSQNKAYFTNSDISYTINTRDSKKEKFSKLQFTDNEVKGIASLFNSRANQLFTGNTATEEQFKLLGSYTKPSPTIIHLATHGFYFDETNADKRSLEEQIVEGIERKSNRFKESSNPLLRSGLVMAGANHAWQGNPPYKGLEDGILTAQEIANLNLSNTKLVVLSACESGLGDIKNNNEGVYGLQRAFKMAGVEYLLVSLWSVDDFTTQKMMRLFYTNLKTGMSIEESYKSMVENIKKQYPDEPFKWASFVLIK